MTFHDVSTIAIPTIIIRSCYTRSLCRPRRPRKQENRKDNGNDTDRNTDPDSSLGTGAHPQIGFWRRLRWG
jgi:hypothetical protein